MARHTSPRCYFNFRSPYSWLALHDLTTYHGDLVQRLDWRPFWDPSVESLALLAAAGGRFVYTPMSREKHFYVLADVRRLATERGLRVTWPIDRAPRWELAHLAYSVAARSGVGTAYAMAISRARWEHGRDISDAATVVEIGADVGMDPARIVRLADDPAAAEHGTAMLMDAYRDGVFGVPFFINGREKFWGVDRLDAFVKTVRSGGPTAPEPVPETVATAAGDDGHAGGCG